MVKTKLLSFLEMCRPQVGLQASMTTFLGAYLSGGIMHMWHGSVIGASLLILFSIAFAFVINDYMDVKVDSINKPNHPIPSGKVTKTEALWILALLTNIELVIGMIIGPTFIFFGAGLLFLSAAYSIFLKGIPLVGNLVIAFLNTSIVLIGAFAANGINHQVFFASLLVFIFTIAQEVLYTARDLDADKTVGLNTTAVSLGLKNTIRLYRFLLIVFMLLAIVPWYLKFSSIWYLLAIVFISIIPLSINLLRLKSHISMDNINQACKISKSVRVASIIVLVLLK